MHVYAQPGPVDVEGIGSAVQITADIDADAEHLTSEGTVVSGGRVAVVVILDDLGDGVSATTGNVSGSSVAARVRAAYNAAKGL